MKEVLRNQEILGATMGSLVEMHESTKFLAAHKIVPVVSRVFDGLEKSEEAFEMMRNGEQFGKIVVRIGHGKDGEKAKL
jgi:D-arabinose 1-dehydrogenase-like Zn-dependent alcohol dehydrogenase